MIWLGLDFEATGVDPEKDSPIEVAAVLWDAKSKRVIHSVSMMLSLPGDIGVTEEITAITGITNKHISERVYTFSHFATALGAMVLECPPTHWIGHNVIEYDMKMFAASWARSLSGQFDEVPDSDVMAAIDSALRLPVIDTMIDVPYGPEVQSKKLKYLASDHGFLNLMAHSALSDVLTTIRIASHYDPEVLALHSSSPMITVRAVVEFAEKDKAKSAGFFFEGSTKRWLYKIRKSRIAEMKWPFDIEILGENIPAKGDPF